MPSQFKSSNHEPDVWWGEHGIDAGLGLVPVFYEPVTDTKVKE